MRILVVAAIAVGGIAMAAPANTAFAQSGPRISVGDGEGGKRPGTSSDIVARAEKEGLLEVIVGVDAPFTTDRALSAAEEASEMAAIKLAQESVLSRVPGAQNVYQFETVPYIAMVVTPDQVRALLETPGVTSVSEDVPAEPMLSQSVKVIKADQLWKKRITGNKQVVAVLDTGAQLKHRAFKRQIRGGACFSTPIPSLNIRTFCRNGKAVDTRTKSANNCTVKGCDHGTHVSGIAMGNAGRSKPYGVAPKAKLVIVQVFRKYTKPEHCAGSPPCIKSSSRDVMKALEWIYKKRNKAKFAAVNLSLGGGRNYTACDDDDRKASIDKLRGVGIATVIASGNNGYSDSISAPACISTAIAVGNTTKRDKVWRSSNHSALVDLMAPGTKIVAPVPGNKWGVKTGTSMAAPHVAGAWALLKQAKPKATVQEVLRALVCTGKEVKRGDITKPRIDVLKAYKVLKRKDKRQYWNFKTQKQVDDWEDELGKWGKRGNALFVHGGGSTVWLAATSPFCAASIAVAAQVKRKDPDTYTHWNSGLFLFSRIDEDKNMSGMWFAYNKYDADDKTNRGQAVIWRISHHNGINNSGGSNALLCTANDVKVNEQRGNVLKVVSIGGNHRFYLNNVLVCSATDTTYKAGDLAMVMAGPSNNNSHQYYVNQVKAKQLEDADVIPADIKPTVPLEVPPNVSPLGVNVRSGSLAIAE